MGETGMGETEMGEKQGWVRDCHGEVRWGGESRWGGEMRWGGEARWGGEGAQPWAASSARARATGRWIPALSTHPHSSPLALASAPGGAEAGRSLCPKACAALMSTCYSTVGEVLRHPHPPPFTLGTGFGQPQRHQG